MHSSLSSLLYEAEERYLEDEDLNNFKSEVDKLSNSIAIHDAIKQHEIQIFQEVADRAIQEFSQTEESAIEAALGNWITILRYCTMALVLDNRDYLDLRLLEWLQGLVKVRQDGAMQVRIYQLLSEQLSQILSAEQKSAIEPLLERANRSIFSEARTTENLN